MKVVHRLELISPYDIKVKTSCGLLPENLLNNLSHAGLNKWKNVTCKKCLAKRRPHQSV